MSLETNNFLGLIENHEYFTFVKGGIFYPFISKNTQAIHTF